MPNVKLLRRTTVLGAGVALVCMLTSGAFASTAMASGHCPGLTNICAFANANWTGGGLGTNGYGETNPNYTVEPSYTPEGCTHSGFNDCASSIDNEGPYNGYYWWNAGCTGERYNNTAYTGTNFLGTYWNDEFSSDRVGYSEHC